MRKSARTDLCGGRSVMIVPTASTDNRVAIPIERFRKGAYFLL
jgi:hypothetical protein